MTPAWSLGLLQPAQACAVLAHSPTKNKIIKSSKIFKNLEKIQKILRNSGGGLQTARFLMIFMISIKIYIWISFIHQSKHHMKFIIQYVKNYILHR